ncbi:MAG: isoprenylcysteine carboxylmethyltransferase family protein [candidate division WOR-3 bacterium]
MPANIGAAAPESSRKTGVATAPGGSTIIGVNFFDFVQLAGLGLFAGLATYRAIRLRRLTGVNAIAPGRASRLALAGLIVTWCWTLLLLWYVLPLGGRPLLPPLDSSLWNSAPLSLAGLVLIVTGLALNVLAHRALGDNWRLGIDERHPGSLVTTGIYRYSRHPIYVFFFLYLLGTFLIEGRLLLLGFWLALSLLLHLEALQEERFLESRFGLAYLDYRSRVRRYWGAGPRMPTAIEERSLACRK